MRRNNNKFTRGPAIQEEGRISTPNIPAIAKVYSGNDMDDGALITAAINAATECEDLGLDGVQCIMNLSQIISDVQLMITHANTMIDYYGQTGGVTSHLKGDITSINKLLNKCKGE